MGQIEMSTNFGYFFAYITKEKFREPMVFITFLSLFHENTNGQNILTIFNFEACSQSVGAADTFSFFSSLLSFIWKRQFSSEKREERKEKSKKNKKKRQFSVENCRFFLCYLYKMDATRIKM